MKRYIAPFAAVLLIAACTAQLPDDNLTEAKQADILELLEMTGALAIGKQMSDAVGANMSQTLKASRPDIAPELFDILQEEVSRTVEENLPEFAARIVPIYHKFFTHREIKGMLKFYRTPLGQKTIRVMPQLLQDSMRVGQQWAEAIGPELQKRVQERFKAEGVDLQASIPSDAVSVAGLYRAL